MPCVAPPLCPSRPLPQLDMPRLHLLPLSLASPIATASRHADHQLTQLSAAEISLPSPFAPAWPGGRCDLVLDYKREAFPLRSPGSMIPSLAKDQARMILSRPVACVTYPGWQEMNCFESCAVARTVAVDLARSALRRAVISILPLPSDGRGGCAFLLQRKTCIHRTTA